MGWIPAIAVLMVIAAAAGGFWGVVVALRRGLPNRGPFLAGVLCGVTVGVALSARRRGLTALAASAINTVIRAPQAVMGIRLHDVAARALAVTAALGRQVPGWSQVFSPNRR